MAKPLALTAIFFFKQTDAFTCFSPAHRTLIKGNGVDVRRKFPTSIFATTEERKEEIREDANEALASVGWAPPTSDEELSSDDPFVQNIEAGIQRDMGVSLDELLNPAKVVNLERDLYNLRLELARLTGKELDINTAQITSEECDGGGGGEEAETIRQKISKKENSLAIERRSVFRGWLKNIFLGQAVLSLGLSWVMVTNPGVLFGSFDWFQGYNLDTSIRVLGFWWWWLFIVPSLRSRRPSGFEKKALDIAFLGTPAISLLSPVVTKDTAIIWLANFAVVAGSYAFAYATDGDDSGSSGGQSQPGWLKFIYKSLDFGSGQERGARK
eukprot:CAMPEP_0195514540 /NCGR_PEP_ID=MMETSP0794_2-20130614/5890_1 /TAXON_ID=515487 /ORGANISM="Stephanopyxis turris, Strain CCMP 815" /LENGTH=326 /DNA_ID=CAMNT_0040642795 /DNA_START=31 /DNA_END=1011 /DNA_ORIENTATION=-